MSTSVITQENHLLLSPERIKFIKKSKSKKRVFQILSELLATGQKNVTQNEIFDALISREKLGNTIVGNGIAIPRASINIPRAKAALVFLKKGIYLKSPDKKNTQLFLAFLIPEKETKKYANMLKYITFELSQNSIIEDISEHKNPQLLIDYLNPVFLSNAKSPQPETSKLKEPT